MYPGREARIVKGRLKEWATAMEANLERVSHLSQSDITTGE